MQIIRTIAWIVVTATLVAFIAMNWNTVPVNFWPTDGGIYIHFDWPVGVVALIFFALGMLPVWLYLRATRWRMKRRIDALENSLRASSIGPAATGTVPDAPGAPLAAPAPIAPVSAGADPVPFPTLEKPTDTL